MFDFLAIIIIILNFYLKLYFNYFLNKMTYFFKWNYHWTKRLFNTYMLIDFDPRSKKVDIPYPITLW
jgi:hypothetical protein